MSCPISTAVVRRRAEIGKAFRSDDPLSNFVVISDFGRRSLIENAARACRKARYATFCGYTESPGTTRIRTGFGEPNETYTYVSIHQRPLHPIPELVELLGLFAEPEALEFMSSVAGRTVTRVSGGNLTCWGPGSFLERHSDFVRGTKLVLTLSLTSRWRRSYGGATVYAWSGAHRAVRLYPRRNTAVLFTPFDGSIHWVEQIAEDAPPCRRFTWTATFS